MSKWEKRPWKEVLEIINGKSQKNVIDDNGSYPIYGSGGIMGYANKYICAENTVIIGRKGNINKPIFVEEKFWNVDTAFGIKVKEEFLLPKYLYYFCVNFNFEKLNTTVTIPSLTKANLLKINIPLPPFEVQKKIAQTLDAASELIQLHKKHLAELDNLIKATFYDMFGDPMLNEQGWEVKALGMFSCLKSGKYIAAAQIHNFNHRYKYPCFGGNGLRGYVEKHSHVGTYSLIGRQGALCGNVQFAQGEFYATEHAIVVSPRVAINPKYLFHILKKLNLNRLASGAAQPGLTVSKLKEVNIPLPPLSLQNKFAAIVTKIEEQKALVQKAIDESQYLFDSLMSQYFE
ncbi:MAG: restriction endonuclease subunit S [Sporomusaceae bacterium]|nr:restriction endonuclease subunit S [Sporomusaceae bacterium]